MEFKPPIKERRTDELILIAVDEDSEWQQEAIDQAKNELKLRGISLALQVKRFRELTENEDAWKYRNRNNEQLVQVASFMLPFDYQVIQSRIESEGIPCFIQDEIAVRINNFWSNAIGGIKMKVYESDAARAIEILKEAGWKNEEAINASSAGIEKNMLGNHSFKNLMSGNRYFFIFIILVAIIIFLVRTVKL